ncbi:hypothetical protein NW759_017483 [Fusarium solani]|nr:hypothetical protein NW759_017483 [Fusarium solani]
MPQPPRIPIDGIRGTLDHGAGSCTPVADHRDPETSKSTVPSSFTYQNVAQPRNGQAALQALLQPSKEPIRVPLDDIRRTWDDLKRQRAEDRRRAKDRRCHTQAVPPDEVRRTLDDLERHRPEQQGRRANTVIVSEEEIARTIATITQQRVEARLRERMRRAYASSEHDGQQAPETRQMQMPATLQPIPSPPERPIRRTPPTRKRPREQQQGLLTPPPTQPSRPPRRQRLAQETTQGTTQETTQETTQVQRKSLESILQYREACFREKYEASVIRSWCKEVPLALQVETPKSFYQAFTDEKTLPISHCVFCYRKHAPCELTTVQWKRLLTPSLLQATRTLQQCRKCLPLDDRDGVQVCRECRTGLENGKLPKVCSVNNMDIGCEHRYPEELDGLSPVEERLIALQAPFGYITKFTVDNKTPSGLSYRKHVKGHIVVFPNKVEDLVATVLPHPLLETIENIHVSWSGSSKPSSADVGHLLQVRKSRVRAALSWLQRNNPLYEHVTINHGEIDGWRYAEGSSVPTLIMDVMQREEPSVAEKTQTDHIVPDTDRGLEANRYVSIEELLTTSAQTGSGSGHCPRDGTQSIEQHHPLPPDDADGDGGR